MKHNWSNGRMDKFFDLRMGKTPPRDNSIYWDDPANNWVAISDMGKSKYIFHTKEQISDTAVSECRMSPVPANTAIMSFKLSIGKAAITTEPIFTNEAIMSFIPKTEYENEITTDYIYYYLLGFKWSGLGNKAVMGVTLNKKSLSNKPFSFPAISLQHKIVAELDQINDLIAKNRELLSQLDALAQSLFYDTFGDTITNQKEWQIVPLDECVNSDCSISYGIVQPGDDYANGIPVVRPVDFIENRFVSVGNLKRIKPEISGSYKRTILSGNEILMCVRGTTGLVRLADKSLNGCNVTRGIVPLSFPRTISRTYIFEYLKQDRPQEFIRFYTRGTTLKQINLSDLRKLPLLLPPLALQEDFAAKVEAIEAQKAKVEAEIAELQTLLDARMDYWFN